MTDEEKKAAEEMAAAEAALSDQPVDVATLASLVRRPADEVAARLEALAAEYGVRWPRRRRRAMSLLCLSVCTSTPRPAW